MESKPKRQRAAAAPRVWPQPPNDRDSPLKAHFRASGTLFELGRRAWLQRLKQTMGTQRFREWQSFCDGQPTVPERNNVYEFFETAEEINTLFSGQRDVSLAIAEWITGALTPEVPPGTRVIDLGCGSGILTGWLARSLPTCDVVGVDGVDNMLHAARQTQSAPRLSFHHWDYQQTPPADLGRFECLVSCLGVDFETVRQPAWDPSLTTLRDGLRYESQKQWVTPLLRNWRRVATASAHLYAVLRIPDLVGFLAVVDAATESGWRLYRETCSTVRAADGQSFPALVFQAADETATLLPEGDLLWLFASQGREGGQSLADLIDPQRRQRGTSGFHTETVASWLWQALTDKTILVDRIKSFDDGHRMRSVTGTSTHWAFQYSHATNGFTALALHPLEQAPVLKPKFHWFSLYDHDE